MDQQKSLLLAFQSNFKEDSNRYVAQRYCHNLIKPIPVKFLNIKNHQKVSRISLKLVCRGYKYISKVGATGEFSATMLEDLHKSQCLKFIRSLEFDPYFCEESGLKPLSKVFKKFNKCIQRANVVIRRLDKEHELNVLCPHLQRLRCLTKLRIDFPSTEGIVQKDFRIFWQGLKRCHLLKNLECNMISLDKIGQKGFRSFAFALHRLYKMENLKYHIKSCITPENDFEDKPAKIKKMLNLKTYHLKISCKTGWTSLTDGAGQFLPIFLRSFPEALNPIKLTLKIGFLFQQKQ